MGSAGRRAAALAVDYAVIACWAGVLAGGAVTVRAILGHFPDVLGTLGPVGSQVLFFTPLTFVVGCYLYLSEAGARSATWGKRRLGLRVVTVREARPGRLPVLTRTVVKLVPWELAHTFVWQLLWYQRRQGAAAEPPAWIMAGLIGAMALAVVWIAITLGTGRGIHDRLAGTMVVDGRSAA